MSLMTKVFTVLTALLSIAVSCFFIAAAAQWENYRQLALDYQSQRDAEITHRMNIQASSEAALALKDDALKGRDDQLAKAQQAIQDLTAKNAELKNSLARAQQEALAFDAGRTKLQEILSVTTNARSALEAHNQKLLTQNSDLQTRLTRMNNRVLELSANVTVLTDEVRNLQEKNFAYERQISDLQKGRQARAVPVEQPGVAGAMPVLPAVKGDIEGRVVRVDGRFASVDVGESAGVQPGMRFMVHRSGDYVADLTVETVRPKEAGGILVLAAAGQDVRPGDSVRLVR